MITTASIMVLGFIALLCIFMIRCISDDLQNVKNRIGRIERRLGRINRTENNNG